MKRLMTAALAAWWASSGPIGQSFVQAQDQIYLLRGAPLVGRITDMSPDAVTIDVRGSARSIPVKEIRRIGLAEDPPELRRARDDIPAGQWENSLETLKRIDPKKIARDLVRRDLQYFVAYCQGKLALAGGGDKAAAEAALRELVVDDPKTYHFYEAAELLGDLALALESYDNALRYYAAIGRAPWPDYRMRSALREARVLVAQGKHAEAMGKYDSVLAAPLDTSEAARQKSIAQVGKAVCLAETGQHQEGIRLVEQLIAKNDPQDGELFGLAYNALGRCHVRAKRPKDAVLAYLHVDQLFFSIPEIHAEALYYLSKLWSEVNKPERAAAARSLLRERYAGSVWAKRE